ncbi:MAG: hypothetical protein J7M19_06180 [Planctomycetes bacterium]|nr:hypothetical protein [Planctomycetota bacterium]
MSGFSSRKGFYPWRLVPYVIAAVMIAYSVILFALIAADVQRTSLLVGSLVP